MAPLRYPESPEPELNEPILIGASAGWSDAGGGASGSAKYPIDRWHADEIAEIEAEDFYDFTQLRPTVKYIHDVRVIEWPQNAFYHHRSGDRDLIIFNGIEPHLKWKTYIRNFMDVVEHYKVSMVVSLGSMFVDYPHTRPMRVTGQAPNEDLQEKAGLYTRGGLRGPYWHQRRAQRHSARHGRAGRHDLGQRAALRQRLAQPAGLIGPIKSLTAMLDIEVPLTRMMRHATAFESQLNEATAKTRRVSNTSARSKSASTPKTKSSARLRSCRPPRTRAGCRRVPAPLISGSAVTAPPRNQSATLTPKASVFVVDVIARAPRGTLAAALTISPVCSNITPMTAAGIISSREFDLPNCAVDSCRPARQTSAPRGSAARHVCVPAMIRPVRGCRDVFVQSYGWCRPRGPARPKASG